MARRLRRTVVVDGVAHPAGTAATAALLKAIVNPRAWEGEPDPEPEPVAAPKKSAPRKKTTAKVESTTVGGASADGSPAGSDPAGGGETPEEPPRGGEGATEEAWLAYATALGIEVPEDAGRDDVIALVDARGSGE